MTKKAYITPVIEEMAGEPECLLAYSLTSTTEGIKTDSTPDEDLTDNRSRQLNVWDDGTGEGW
jgi:hypothetical protein